MIYRGMTGAPRKKNSLVSIRRSHGAPCRWATHRTAGHASSIAGDITVAASQRLSSQPYIPQYATVSVGVPHRWAARHLDCAYVRPICLADIGRRYRRAEFRCLACFYGRSANAWKLPRRPVRWKDALVGNGGPWGRCVAAKSPWHWLAGRTRPCPALPGLDKFGDCRWVCGQQDVEGGRRRPPAGMRPVRRDGRRRERTGAENFSATAAQQTRPLLRRGDLERSGDVTPVGKRSWPDKTSGRRWQHHG